jgi:hypothetical protein
MFVPAPSCGYTQSSILKNIYFLFYDIADLNEAQEDDGAFPQVNVGNAPWP